MELPQLLCFTGANVDLVPEGREVEHERDELRAQHHSRLSSAGRELLAGLKRVADSLEPPSEETLARAATLPPSDREEIAAIFGAMAQEFAKRQRENMRNAAFAASAADVIREAQERQRAAGRPVNSYMTLGDALEILGR